MSDFGDEDVGIIVRFLTLSGKNSDQIGADLRRVLKEDAPEKEELERIIADQEKEMSDDESDDDEDKFEFERNVLETMVMTKDKISHAAIIGYDDALLKAAAPKGFKPDKKALKNISNALKGDITGIAASGIALGSGTKKIVPAKIDPGSFIYGSDGRGGGCSICKSKTGVLILIYRSGPSNSTRLAREVAEYMEDNDH